MDDHITMKEKNQVGVHWKQVYKTEKKIMIRKENSLPTPGKDSQAG